MWVSVPWKYVRLILATEAIIRFAATAVTPNPVVDATHGELGATLRCLGAQHVVTGVQDAAA